LFQWLKNPWVWIPSSAIVAVGVIAGVIGFFTRNWLLAMIAALSILLVVLVVLMVRMLVHREREERLDLGLEDEARLEKARAGAASDAAGADLKERFRFALSEIKSKLGGVYELPWYLVIGGLGSGKSALLSESGLDCQRSTHVHASLARHEAASSCSSTRQSHSTRRAVTYRAKPMRIGRSGRTYSVI
jgi:type VI protein secretion system component VasK